MLLFTLALFLGACFPVAQPAQQAQNTPELIDVQAQINTSVAQTMEAQNQIGTFVAQTVEAQATPTFTATPFSIPTLTPFVIATSTTRPSGGGGGSSGSSGPVNNGPYDCELVNQKPRDGDRIWHPGEDFDVVWTIKNTGNKKLPIDTYITPIGGDPLSPTAGYLLGQEILPGKTFNIRIEVVAPEVFSLDKEQFTMNWAVIVLGSKLCRPYISIFVQNRGVK